jgi:hypothetical protein
LATQRSSPQADCHNFQKDPMLAEQFTAKRGAAMFFNTWTDPTELAVLMRMRRPGARGRPVEMLVDGITQAEAAQRTGQSLWVASQGGAARSQGGDAGTDRERLTAQGTGYWKTSNKPSNRQEKST